LTDALERKVGIVVADIKKGTHKGVSASTQTERRP